MSVLSKLGLRQVRTGAARLDFIVDGIPLKEKFLVSEFSYILDKDEQEPDPSFAEIHKMTLASRLGCGSRDSQLGALKQLLLKAEPELPDGRRRLYICGGDCECEHIACRIESDGGRIVWHDFQLGSPARQGAETFASGEWKRIEWAPNPSPKGRDLTLGPLWFDEEEYRQLFQPLLLKFNSPANSRPE